VKRLPELRDHAGNSRIRNVACNNARYRFSVL
jgi:hypothetical protein